METTFQTSEQPDLIEVQPTDGAALVAFAEGRVPVHTGAGVARDRERYEAIVQAIAECQPRRAIMRAFRVGQHTLDAIEEREARLVATLRDRMATKFKRAAVETLDEFMEQLRRGEVPPATQWVAAATFTDKMLLLSGAATSRHEVVSREVSQVGLAEQFERMKRAEVAEVVEIGTTPDSESGASTGESL